MLFRRQYVKFPAHSVRCKKNEARPFVFSFIHLQKPHRTQQGDERSPCPKPCALFSSEEQTRSGSLAQAHGVLRKATLAVNISAWHWGTPPESQCTQLSLLVGHHKTICFLPLRIALTSFHPRLLRTAKCLHQDWCSFGGVGIGKIQLKCNKPNYFFTSKVL